MFLTTSLHRKHQKHVRLGGAILISIVTMTVLAVVIEAVADVPSWGLTTPKWPASPFGSPFGSPGFGLIGQVSLFGGFDKAGALTGVLFVCTVLLSRFFDASHGHDHGRQRAGPHGHEGLRTLWCGM